MGWMTWISFLAGTEIFLFATMSIPWPAQHPIQCVPGVLFPDIWWPECEADHSPPLSVEVKNV